MVEVLLPDKLKEEIENFIKSLTGNKKFRLHEKEYCILSMPPYSLDFTHFAGKATEIIYSIIFGYGKKGFDVFKVDENLYVSSAYQPFYSNIRKQKEEIENNIKAQLAQIATAITDTQLIAHDYRKYKYFLKIFLELDEIQKKLNEEKNKEKIEELKKRKKELEQSLRNIFIDQVDIYTGDFSIINMARTRWTTFISDFLSLEEEKTPEDILQKFPNITKAEAIQLAKKNQLYLIWREEFKRVVKEREAELRKLLIMRKNSIDKYKEMLRPLIARYFSFKEEPSIFTSTSLSFIKPATYPLLIESTKLWLIKSIPPFYFEYEKIRQASLSLERIGLISENIIKLVDKSKEEKIKKIVMPVEPSVDRVVLAGLEVINQKFGTNFSINDVLDIRESIYKKEYEVSPDKERWKLSPYYVFVEISLDRVLLKTYSGIEIEDFAFSIKPYLISQNLAFLMYLQTKALDTYYEQQINSFFGESLLKEIEIEVDVKGQKTKQKLNIWLDIRSLDYIFEEEENYKKLEEEKRREFYNVLSEYVIKFEETFLKRKYFAPYLLYERSFADEYFFDYVVATKIDIDRTIASAFGFPI
ncbi:MAG: hypothetical protein QW678_02375 [Candidatus Aenigmatarchaeota archaeon]